MKKKKENKAKQRIETLKWYFQKDKTDSIHSSFKNTYTLTKKKRKNYCFTNQIISKA